MADQGARPMTSHGNSAETFKIKILSPENVDVYLSCRNGHVPWPLVGELDRAGLRVIGDVPDLPGDDDRSLRIMRGCSGLVTVLSRPDFEQGKGAKVLRDLRLGAELDMPIAIFRERDVDIAVSNSGEFVELRIENSEPISSRQQHLYGPEIVAGTEGDVNGSLRSLLDRFRRDGLGGRDAIPPYAFFIGRLERDFAQAREAIRVAVEGAAGIPFLWADDGRHRTNVDSVRERTRLLIKHAAFVIADLTLGPESPERENPSRAHEIGMAIAYGRPFMLSSQEPRRYPYFSVADMQMSFWAAEPELERNVRDWIFSYRETLGRDVLNYRLESARAGSKSAVAPPSFSFDAKRRFVGPGMKKLPEAQFAFAALGLGVMVLLLTHLIAQRLHLGASTYGLAFVGAALIVVLLPRRNGGAQQASQIWRRYPQFLVLAFLAILALLLVSANVHQ
jgi:hypothetical protein